MLRWRHAVVRDGLTTRRRPAAAALRAVLHRMAQTHQRCMSFVTALSGWHRRAESGVAHCCCRTSRARTCNGSDGWRKTRSCARSCSTRSSRYSSASSHLAPASHGRLCASQRQVGRSERTDSALLCSTALEGARRSYRSFDCVSLWRRPAGRPAPTLTWPRAARRWRGCCTQ
jgi:hypothetical protein